MSSAVNPSSAGSSSSAGRPSSAGNPGAGSAEDPRRPGSTGGPGHQELVARQKEQFGGMKFGCSFFGWLTAVGTGALLVALLLAATVSPGLNNLFRLQQSGATVRTLGIAAAVALLVVLLVAYIAGGYVAARMARFSGLKQGFGVWLWSIIALIVFGVLGAVAGNSRQMQDYVNGLPRLTADSGVVTGSILSGLAVLVVSLAGALLGGLAGMRYHRRVDRAGFEEA